MGTVRAIVDDYPVAASQPLLARHPPRHNQEVTEQRRVSIGGGADATNLPLRDDEDVGRGLRVDVVEREGEVVFKHLVRRDLRGPPRGAR